MTEIAIAERLFVTGVLDELKVCFSYSYQVGSLVTVKLFILEFEFPHFIKCAAFCSLTRA